MLQAVALDVYDEVLRAVALGVCGVAPLAVALDVYDEMLGLWPSVYVMRCFGLWPSMRCD